MIEAGLWDEPGSLRFSPDAKGNSGSGIVGQAGELEVRTSTIDGVTQELGLDRVDFIKMDIEGAERRALAGSASVLKRWIPRMAVCTYHAEGDAVAIQQVAYKAQPNYESAATGSQIYFYERTQIPHRQDLRLMLWNNP